MITPLRYEILLALADCDRDGYGIIKEIEARQGAGAAPSTGALYLALQRLEREGLVAESRAPSSESDDARRPSYRLTRSGRAESTAESRRLTGLVEAARGRKLLPDGGDA